MKQKSILTHVYYSGTVQGVGFRYTVVRLAKGLDLKGRVCNLSDGRVEMEVEGEQSIVDEFLKRIDTRYDGYIRDKQVNTKEAQGLFKDFEIKF